MGRPLDGYPTSIGNKVLSVFPHTGPASYTQMTTNPVAGGDTVTFANEAGMKFADKLHGGKTDSGLYSIEVFLPAANPSTKLSAAPAKTAVLRWVVVATGAQVAGAVDLSAEIVRLEAIGPV